MITSQNLLLRIQLGVIITYFIVKFWLRPFVLENEYGGSLKILVLSYPNYCEAIVGSIMIVFLLLLGNSKVKKDKFLLPEKYMPFFAVLIAGTYVILQEFKVHNLGGNNVYDIYDVGFSVVGLVTILCLLLYIQPKISL